MENFFGIFPCHGRFSSTGGKIFHRWKTGGREADPTNALAPFVFGVFAAEFLLDAGVVVAPEAGEVLGDLDGALAGGEDVEDEGDAAGGEGGEGIDAEEFLDAGGDEGFGGVGVLDLEGAAVGEVDAFGGEFVDEGGLGGGEEGFDGVEDGAVLDFLV